MTISRRVEITAFRRRVLVIAGDRLTETNDVEQNTVDAGSEEGQAILLEAIRLLEQRVAESRSRTLTTNIELNKGGKTMNELSTIKSRVGGLVLTIFLVFAAELLAAENGKIAFVSNRDGNDEIYVMNPDGSSQTRLTRNDSVDNNPAFSPDGRKIAFRSLRDGEGYGEIYVMNANGTNQRRLTFEDLNAYSPTWSPDGTRIAFIAQVPQLRTAIVIINLDRTGQTVIYHSASLNHLDSLDWSPTGTKFVVSEESADETNAIITVNADGSGTAAIIAGDGFAAYFHHPTWSPDGSRILYGSDTIVSFFPFEIKHSLDVIDPAGANRRTLFDGDSGDPAWSPDGTRIVYGASFASNQPAAISVVNSDGSGNVSITNSGARDYDPSWGPVAESAASRTAFDFDGDGRADVSVFRPSNGFWWLRQSSSGITGTQLGNSADTLAPADYDGDGKTDIAIYRDGLWMWMNSSTGVFQQAAWGIAEDIPQPGDLNGDGRAELTVFRDGTWYAYNNAKGQAQTVQFGLEGDRPVAADYDGDGRLDHAVYRDGTWYLLGSTQGFTAIPFGLQTDRLVPADYDADAKADVAVYRDGTWYVLRSRDGFTAFQFGLGSDIPAPADYDGDGFADAAVFREGIWYLREGAGRFSSVPFGQPADRPVPASYVKIGR